MGRVSESEVRSVLRFVGTVERGVPDDPIPQPALAGLRDLIEADAAEYFELRRADRGVMGHSTSDAFEDAAGSAEAMVAFGWQNPLAWRRYTPADGALRLSERIGHRELEALEWYQGFMRPNHLRDTLKVWLWSSAESVACIQLWRYGTAFTRRQQDLLAILHEHLIVLRSEALGTGTSAAAPDAAVTAREAEILTWIARGASDAAIGRRLGIAPATVAKHVENAFAKLGAHSRSEATGRILFGRRSGDA